MQKTIISDTSCIILLDKVNCLPILNKLFGNIIITKEIADEFGKELPKWFEIKSPSNRTYQKILEASLDQGEASAIALAIEQTDCLIIIDDLKGRRYAEQLGLKITGTLGVIIDAKLQGIIPSIRPILEEIKGTNFRLTPDLEQKALTKAKEEM
jgi:predicted nucleic acid-binding protein